MVKSARVKHNESERIISTSCNFSKRKSSKGPSFFGSENRRAIKNTMRSEI
ncbi:hypothetical protein PUN28_014315 [Cardiocondyla obscurior]|uniref:Ribosomal protein L32 n=1 Tax=Cardiocondyla obscurior TaxID=286306 RepID=A0AAW2F1P1_9HYME